MNFKKLFLFLLFVSASVQAQDGEINNTDLQTKDSRDRVVLEFNWVDFANKPDALETEWFNRGINIYFTYDFPFNNNEHWSFAPGIGVSSSNIYNNSRPTLQLVGEEDPIRYSVFEPLPDSLEIRINKISSNFLEVPLELRYHSNADKNGRSFKLGFGFRGGLQLSTKYKYKGEGVDELGSTDLIKVKSLLIPNVYKWRFGPSFRIGYGEFSLVGYYSISTFFEKNQGPGLHTWSVGFSFNSF